MVLTSIRRHIATKIVYPFRHYQQGSQWIREIGHRAYVGGKWELIGRLQFQFLKQQGLSPQSYLLDIGCGCLRAGRHFIDFLELGHYAGLDKEPLLLSAGIKEIGILYRQKKPTLWLNSEFQFDRVSWSPNFVIAHSLFTHLNKTSILKCMSQLRKKVQPGCQFYTSFFEGPYSNTNPKLSHDHLAFFYSKDEMTRFGNMTGWHSHYIGEWSHPRKQKMMFFEAKP